MRSISAQCNKSLQDINRFVEILFRVCHLIRSWFRLTFNSHAHSMTSGKASFKLMPEGHGRLPV